MENTLAFISWVQMYFELNDTHTANGKEHWLFEGPINRKHQAWANPCNLPEDTRPPYQKRRTIQDVAAIYEDCMAAESNRYKIATQAAIDQGL